MEMFNNTREGINPYSMERRHVVANELIQLYDSARSSRFGRELDVRKNKSDSKIESIEKRFLILADLLIENNIDPREYMAFIMKKDNTPLQPHVNVITSKKKVSQFIQEKGKKVSVSPGSKVRIMLNRFRAGIDPYYIVESTSYHILDKYIFAKKTGLDDLINGLTPVATHEWSLIPNQIRNYLKNKFPEELINFNF